MDLPSGTARFDSRTPHYPPLTEKGAANPKRGTVDNITPTVDTPQVTADTLIPLADVLDMVRDEAERKGWCEEAEEAVTRFLNVRLQEPEYTDCGCGQRNCRGEAVAETRFRLAGDSQATVRAADLKTAIRDARDAYGTHGLLGKLADRFGLDAVAVPVYQLRFTVTVADSNIRFFGDDSSDQLARKLRMILRDGDPSIVWTREQTGIEAGPTV